MSFSPAGLLVSLAVLAPNLLLLRFPPRSPVPSGQVPPLLVGVERIGQGLCLVIPASTAPGATAWSWATPILAALAGYYALWGRYVLTGRPPAALYRSLWGVPVPMAILPVVVFLATAGWLGNPWIAVSAVVLAVGHVPASMIIAGRTRR